MYFFIENSKMDKLLFWPSKKKKCPDAHRYSTIHDQYSVKIRKKKKGGGARRMKGGRGQRMRERKGKFQGIKNV